MIAAIAVPVRDEAERLPALLRGLAGQRNAPPFVLCLHFDGCVDASADVAAGMASSLPFPVVTSSTHLVRPSNVGRARARAFALAEAHAPALLSTDADTVPDPDWIAATMAALTRADLVAGRVRIATASPLHRRLGEYLDRLHAHRRALDPIEWEAERTHHWTSAASLAFGPSVYRAIGPFAPLPRGEDGEIADRAWRAGFRVRRDGAVRVTTSGRRQGRVAGGFACHLASLERADAAPSVAHPADESWRYRRHALARAAFGSADLGGLAAALCRPLGELARTAAAARNADAFAARVVGTPPGGMRQVALPAAEGALAALLADALVPAA